MLYPARWTKITVDQSKVLKNQLYRPFHFFRATQYMKAPLKSRNGKHPSIRKENIKQIYDKHNILFDLMTNHSDEQMYSGYFAFKTSLCMYFIQIMWNLLGFVLSYQVNL